MVDQIYQTDPAAPFTIAMACTVTTTPHTNGPIPAIIDIVLIRVDPCGHLYPVVVPPEFRPSQPQNPVAVYETVDPDMCHWYIM